MNSFDSRAINPVSGTPYDGDWNNFGPWFGFASKVLGHENTVVRGGYGIFYAHPFDAGVPNAVALGFSTSRDMNSPDNGITAPIYLRNGVPAAPAVMPKLDDSFGGGPGWIECQYSRDILRAEPPDRVLTAVQSRCAASNLGIVGFDTPAFVQPAPYRFGNQGVGVLRGPGLINFDGSLLRDFRWTERVRLEFRGEFLDALNHTNFNLPGRVLGGAGFGVVSSASPARQVQTGCRIIF